MNRRTLLKASIALATTSHTALANGEMSNTLPVASVEQPHLKLKRLSWEIADLLNELDPGVDFVAIRPSKAGRHAVYFGFDVEQPLQPRVGKGRPA